MLVGYARVSTDLQSTDGQIDALNTAGCERVFEESMSGTRADRPQLAAALEFAREADVLVVTRLDRLARSMRQLLTTVDALPTRGIGLRSLHENIDTTSATGRLVLHIFAALGQFEVELLRERTRIALAASRARGRIGGRPPALDAIKVTAAKAMLASGTMTASEIALQVGCSASTLYRHVPGGRTAIAESGTRRRLIANAVGVRLRGAVDVGRSGGDKTAQTAGETGTMSMPSIHAVPPARRGASPAPINTATSAKDGGNGDEDQTI